MDAADLRRLLLAQLVTARSNVALASREVQREAVYAIAAAVEANARSTVRDLFDRYGLPEHICDRCFSFKRHLFVGWEWNGVRQTTQIFFCPLCAAFSDAYALFGTKVTL